MDIFLTIMLSAMTVMSAMGAGFMFYICNKSKGFTDEQDRALRGQSFMVGLIWIFIGLIVVSRVMVKGCV